jgi:hypothetical protein
MNENERKLEIFKQLTEPVALVIDGLRFEYNRKTEIIGAYSGNLMLHEWSVNMDSPLAFFDDCLKGIGIVVRKFL